MAPKFTFCSYGRHLSHALQPASDVTGFVLEIDDSLSGDDLAHLINRLNFCCVVYTAFSSTEDEYRVCIAIPLPSPMSTEEFKNNDVALRAAKLLGITISRDSLEPDRFWPEPCRPKHTEDAHALESMPNHPPIDVSTLPKLATGDRERFCGTGWQDVLSSEKSGDTAISDFISLYIRKRLNGVNPIYTENCFYVYETRHWKSVSVKTLAQSLFLEYFDGKVKYSIIERMIAAMKIRFHRDIFPVGTNEAARLSLMNTRIALANSTINPISGKTAPDLPEDYLRGCLPFAFDPDAKCPRFHQFLAEVFRDDRDKLAKIDFLQEMMGYLLVDRAPGRGV